MTTTVLFHLLLVAGVVLMTLMAVTPLVVEVGGAAVAPAGPSDRGPRLAPAVALPPRTPETAVAPVGHGGRHAA